MLSHRSVGRKDATSEGRAIRFPNHKMEYRGRNHDLSPPELTPNASQGGRKQPQPATLQSKMKKGRTEWQPFV